MNYCKIINYDTANAKGLSVVLFVSGCSHHCKECHNPETWSLCAGRQFSSEVENELVHMAYNPHIENFVLSGGDPFHPENAGPLAEFLSRTMIWKEKTIICYTGYTLQELIDRGDKMTNCLLRFCDIIIDGEYDNTKKPKGLDYRGSWNQQAWEKCYSGFINISDEYFEEVTENDRAAAGEILVFI